MPKGIFRWGTYLPHRRLDRSTIAAVAGSGGGRGHRTVASYDEDTTTMGVEAARAVRASGPAPSAVWFSTTTPAYLDKTNASAIHAALQLPAGVAAYDVAGSVRSSLGALRAGLQGADPALVVVSDVRDGMPGSAEESSGGDAATAMVVGEGPSEDLAAELLAWSVSSDEFLDRWRLPGARSSKVWEERFGEERYVSLALPTWQAALADAGMDEGEIDHLIVAGPHDRAARSTVKRIALPDGRVADNLATTVGNPGAAQPWLLLADVLEQAAPDQVIALVVLADGVEVLLWRTGPSVAAMAPRHSVRSQIDSGGRVSYGRFLAWRGMLPVELPRRPEPARPSAPAAGRATPWKFGFVGSETSEGMVHLPPQADDSRIHPMADAVGRVVTSTVDRLAYSPSPPIVFAVVDFEGGGRLPLEITDADTEDVEVGLEVEMTFRRLFTADGIHNYFWKARPARVGKG